ncbi:MAG: potassium channel protein [Acidobacteria bacterium]|nr:potassium channel protein [Acidobacteriota bacterium]
MHHIPRRLAFISAAILATLLIGTAGFVLLENYPLFDAFYMSLTTIATVGYKEVHDLSRVGRIFNSFLIFFGVSTMFLAIGAMTQTIIELELGEYFGKRRMKRMIEKLKNHYILCGFGRVGRAAAAELQREKVPFVVVDRDPGKVERAIRAGMIACQADSTRDDTLQELGIERAVGLIAALATDADNLFLIVSAKSLNPTMRIAARAAEEQAERKLRQVGADVVYTPYNTTGYRLAQSLLQPHVYEFIDVATKNIGLDITIEQVRVADTSEFVSKSLRDMQLRRDLGVIVLAIRKADGEMRFNPPAEAEMAGGDHLIVMGKQANLRRLETMLAGAQ